jgi:hypothetical protein
MQRRLALILVALIFLPLCGFCQPLVGKQASGTHATGYPITPVDIRAVTLTDDFWLPIIERVQAKTIAYALAKCEEEGRLANFLIAGGRISGSTHGAMPFDDTDVYKIIEGASTSLISAPNPLLARRLDSLIAMIAVGQEPDGYLTTWRTIDPAKPPAPWVKVIKGVRWESLEASHELYNAGHLYEAAYQHFQATGQRNFLDIALKNADLVVQTFGEGSGKIGTVPGHQIIETGLIKLYQATGKEAYLQLARYFLDHRGDSTQHALFGPYAQDHLPVVQQEEVVGHAVRAVYMYAAMTDIAAIQGDSAYRQAVDALWQNMVSKKMYLTGGIGALHEGEAFGANYELPNLTAYSETCAAIGSVSWNHRLHSLTGESQYLDVVEHTLYNGLLSGLSLDGTHFFYPNALASDGAYPFNRGACTRQSWFDCSCCPTNLIRLLPTLPGLIYSQAADTIYLNLYAANQADLELPGGQVQLIQETQYPWQGQVQLRVRPAQPGTFTHKLRVPGWARGEVLPGGLYHYVDTLKGNVQVAIDGKKQALPVRDGYLTLTRAWQTDQTVTLTLPMAPRKVLARPEVVDDRGLVAITCGPMVYAVESIDQPDAYEGISVTPQDTFVRQLQQDLLGGVPVIRWGRYQAIPYYAWSNRGIGRMRVWLPYDN